MKVQLAKIMSMVAILCGVVAATAQAPDQAPPPPPRHMMDGPGFGHHRPPMESILGPQGAEGRWWNNATVVDRLKLSDEQRKTMDQILLDHRKDLIDKRAAVEKAELDLEPLVSADQPNETQIISQIDEVAQARAELEKANARFLLAIRGKLTADQWKGLKAWRSERVQQRHRGWGPGAPQAAPPAGPGPQGMMNEVPDPDNRDVDSGKAPAQ